MKKIISISILLVILSGFLLSLPIVSASVDFREQINKTNPLSLKDDGSYNDNERLFAGDISAEDPVGSFIVSLVKESMKIIIVVCTALLIYGGYRYAISAEALTGDILGDKRETTNKAKSTITQALIGLILALLAYSMVNIVVNVIGDTKAPQQGYKYEVE